LAKQASQLNPAANEGFCVIPSEKSRCAARIPELGTQKQGLINLQRKKFTPSLTRVAYDLQKPTQAVLISVLVLSFKLHTFRAY
jgi:hypothetical protein